MKPQHPVMSRLTRGNYSGLCYRNDISEYQGWVNLVFINSILYPKISGVKRALILKHDQISRYPTCDKLSSLGDKLLRCLYDRQPGLSSDGGCAYLRGKCEHFTE